MLRFFLICLSLLVAGRLDAVQTFLYLEGIPGEARSARHGDWIEVQSISFGAAQTATRTSFLPVSIVKLLDKATPRLNEAVASGKHIESAVIDILRTEPTGIRLIQVKLGDVLVASAQQSGAAGQSPFESVTLSFGSAKWIYTEVSSDGRALRDIACSWNVVANSGSGGTILADSDNDGLPDDYERLYGLKVDFADALGDLDNDGMTNIDEFRAGTIPNKTDSIFQMTGARSATGAATLNWPSTPGKTYRLLGTASPGLPFKFIRFLTEAEATSGRLDLQTTADYQFFILESE